MSFTRWLPTFLGFPLGGLLAFEIVGGVEGAGTGAAAGAIAGAVIGAAQALSLGSRVSGVGWTLHTIVGLSAGGALAALVTGAGTTTQELVVSGLIAGSVMGAAQAPALRVGARAAGMWAAVTSGAWALGWLMTSSIGVDVERAYVVFGASGAIVATVLTGLALRAILHADPVRPVVGAQS
jgi:hypothetical protein